MIVLDRYQALHTFWSSFGLQAYDENTVPEDVTFPYITYEASTASVNEKIPASASLWYRSTSWDEISRKAEQISEQISWGGSSVVYDTGRLWVTKEAPFAQRMSEPSDSLVRRIVLQVSVEFQ